MPRIDAPTVAEHHRRRRAELIDAGLSVVAEQGVEGLTLGAVGVATGLARSSVYQYFPSTAALIAAMVEGAFPPATERLAAAVRKAAEPRTQVDAYVRAAIELAGEETHRSLHALASSDLPAECRARLAELHQQHYAPLRSAIADLGVDDPDLTTMLVAGVIRAAAQAIMDGTPPAQVTRDALALLHHGLEGWGDRRVARPTPASTPPTRRRSAG